MLDAQKPPWMAEESALKPRHLPSKCFSHRDTGGPSGIGHLYPMQPADGSKKSQAAYSQTLEDDLLEWARNLLDHTPGVRSDLVRSLQIQIDVGLFSIDMELLTERLVPHVCRSLVVEGIGHES